MSEVICDWLDVTYSPDDFSALKLTVVVNQVGANLRSSVDGLDTWAMPEGGVLKLSTNSRFCRVSASGGFLAGLREFDLLEPFVTALSTQPHRVTRIDCALDVWADSPVLLADLIKRYPHECSLTRKAVRTKRTLETRADGLDSGTFYVGSRSSGSVTARVYDKQLQLWQVHGKLVSPCTRYEITVKRSLGATLRDAVLPCALFWHVAAPSLLPLPPHAPVWSPADPDDLGWTAEMPEFLPYATLKNRVENSPDIPALLKLADSVGPEGRTALIRLLTNRIENHSEITPAKPARKTA